MATVISLSSNVCTASRRTSPRNSLAAAPLAASSIHRIGCFKYVAFTCAAKSNCIICLAHTSNTHVHFGASEPVRANFHAIRSADPPPQTSDCCCAARTSEPPQMRATRMHFDFRRPTGTLSDARSDGDTLECDAAPANSARTAENVRTRCPRGAAHRRACAPRTSGTRCSRRCMVRKIAGG